MCFCLDDRRHDDVLWSISVDVVDGIGGGVGDEDGVFDTLGISLCNVAI